MGSRWASTFATAGLTLRRGCPLVRMGGLMAHTRKLDSGLKRWQARWTDPSGKERTRAFAKKSDSEKHLTSVEHSKLSGTYIDIAAQKVTVGELAEQWFVGKINLKPTTKVRYRSALDVHVLPRWGSVPVNRVTFGDAQSWLAILQSAGHSGASVRKVAGVLCAVLDLAVRERRVPSNPCEGVDLPRANKQRRTYLTAEQVEKLADAVIRTSPPDPGSSRDVARRGRSPSREGRGLRGDRWMRGAADPHVPGDDCVLV